MDQVLFVNPFIPYDIKNGRCTHDFNLCACQGMVAPVTPPTPVKAGVDGKTYSEYRTGLDSACADVVIATRCPDGTYRVLTIKRSLNKAFGGKWWMQGGAVHCYKPLFQFLQEIAKKECGTEPTIVAFLCLTRTCAADHIASTTQPCFLGLVNYGDVVLKGDADHSAAQLFSLNELNELPDEEKHWYPTLAFKLALQALAES